MDEETQDAQVLPNLQFESHLEYPDQFSKMIVSYADVGVEVGVQEKVITSYPFTRSTN